MRSSHRRNAVIYDEIQTSCLGDYETGIPQRLSRRCHDGNVLLGFIYRGSTSTHTLLCGQTLTYETSLKWLCTHQTSVEKACSRSPDSECEIMRCKVVQLARVLMSHSYSGNVKEQSMHTLTRGIKARSETELIYETLFTMGRRIPRTYEHKPVGVFHYKA